MGYLRGTGSVRGVIVIAVAKALPAAGEESVTTIDSFTEPYNVGDKSEHGYWVITAINEPSVEEPTGTDTATHVGEYEWQHGEGFVGEPGLPEDFVYRVEEGGGDAIFIIASETGFGVKYRSDFGPSLKVGAKRALFYGPEAPPRAPITMLL